MNMSASCVSFKNAIVWAQGVLKFGLDEGVPLEPQNLYPSLRVILAEKVPIVKDFSGVLPCENPKIWAQVRKLHPSLRIFFW